MNLSLRAAAIARKYIERGDVARASAFAMLAAHYARKAGVR